MKRKRTGETKGHRRKGEENRTGTAEEDKEEEEEIRRDKREEEEEIGEGRKGKGERKRRE
jgi:hypothetical protein